MERIRTSTYTLLQKNHRQFLKSRAFSAGANGLLQKLRQQNENDVIALPEYKARANIGRFLAGRVNSHSPCPIAPPSPPSIGYKNILTPEQMITTLDAAMATFHLHVESRIASLCGQGFYTIGPCGEEMLASIGYALDPDADAMALHYRHLSVSILRQLRLGRKLEDIVLDRARGHVISKLDPVTGGVRLCNLLCFYNYTTSNANIANYFPL